MELQQLRVFVAVAEELHFAHAAERLHMAQPPVSRTIQQLERELHTQLFVRSPRAVRLTATGEVLLASAREVLESVERATSAVEASRRGVVGRVRIGYTGASTRALVARLATAMRERVPGVQVELRSHTYERPVSGDFAQPIMSKVLRGELDIGIGRWDLVPAGVHARVLLAERLVMALPRQHRLATRDSVTMGDFRDEHIISTPQQVGSVLFDRLQKLCYGAGFDPDIVQIAPETSTAMSLVGAGLGASLTLSSVADAVNDPSIVFVPVSDSTDPVELRIAWHHEPPNPAVRTVLDVAEEVLPSPDIAGSGQ